MAKAGGGKMLAVAGRCRQARDVKRMFAETKKTFGRLDFLFNDAGFGAPPVPMEDTAGRDLEVGGGREPDGLVPVRAGSHAHVQGAEAAGGAHRQQRLNLGAHAAAELGGLYGDQACHHWTDEVHRADGRRSTSPAGSSTSATPTPPWVDA